MGQTNQDVDLMPCTQYITSQSPPPHTEGKYPIYEEEISPLDEGMVMEIFSLTYDEIQKKTIKATKKHFSDNLTHPSFIKENLIVMDTNYPSRYQWPSTYST